LFLPFGVIQLIYFSFNLTPVVYGNNAGGDSLQALQHGTVMFNESNGYIVSLVIWLSAITTP